ncbi:hypothetical protein [Streptomyces sp. NPDC002540]
MLTFTPDATELRDYLRIPLTFDVTAQSTAFTVDQAQELRVRQAAQRILADRTHHSADTRWEDLSLGLSGATLIDFDLSECHLGYGDFSGAQLYGTTSFEEALFGAGVYFCIRGTRSGCASFHGDATFIGARFGSEPWNMRNLMEWGLKGCVFHAQTTEAFR